MNPTPNQITECDDEKQLCEIVVEYEAYILGAGVFWRGSPDNVGEIRNIPARQLAELVAVDGQTRKLGMWTVRAIKRISKG